MASAKLLGSGNPTRRVAMAASQAGSDRGLLLEGVPKGRDCCPLETPEA